jgi:hypothetical protein
VNRVKLLPTRRRSTAQQPSYRILKELEAGANSKMDIMIGWADASYLPPRDELLEAVLMIGNAEGSARSAPKSLRPSHCSGGQCSIRRIAGEDDSG